MTVVHVLFYYESEGRDDNYILLNKDYGLPTIDSPADIQSEYVLYNYKTYFKTAQIDSSKYIKIKLKPSALVPILPKLPTVSYDAIMLFLPMLEQRILKASA
jgi:hypothetical protein